MFYMFFVKVPHKCNLTTLSYFTCSQQMFYNSYSKYDKIKLKYQDEKRGKYMSGIKE